MFQRGQKVIFQLHTLYDAKVQDIREYIDFDGELKREYQLVFIDDEEPLG